MMWEDCPAEWVLRGAQVKGGHLDLSRSCFVPIAATDGYSLDAGIMMMKFGLCFHLSEKGIYFSHKDILFF